MLVPKTLRNELKRLLYTGHLGMLKPIDRAKKSFTGRESIITSRT